MNAASILSRYEAGPDGVTVVVALTNGAVYQGRFWPTPDDLAEIRGPGARLRAALRRWAGRPPVGRYRRVPVNDVVTLVDESDGECWVDIDAASIVSVTHAFDYRMSPVGMYGAPARVTS